jgi:hypothetical protein
MTAFPRAIPNRETPSVAALAVLAGTWFVACLTALVVGVKLAARRWPA